MAAIFKILLSLLLRNYWTDFNQISHTGSWWCLVVSNWISDRSDIQDGRHCSHLENLVIATPQKLLDGFWSNFTYRFLMMSSCVQLNFGPIRHPRWPPLAAIFKILLSLLLRNYWTDFDQISHTGSWWCLVVSNWISDRSDIQDGRHGSHLENLVIATPQKLLDGFWSNFTYRFLMMSSCVQLNFGPIRHPRWPPRQPSLKSCYRYSSETTGRILIKFHIQVPDDV